MALAENRESQLFARLMVLNLFYESARCINRLAIDSHDNV